MKETLREIKKQLRLSMNGVVSSSMRTKGVEYRLNFGVSSPSLVGIAQRYTPSAELAELLWSEPVRECRILATLLYPVDTFTPDIANRWMETVNNPELIDLWCFHLLDRLPFAERLVSDWLASENPFARQTALALASRLLLKKRCSSPFREQLICSIAQAKQGRLSEFRVVNCMEKLWIGYPEQHALIKEQIDNSALSPEAKEEFSAIIEFHPIG